MLYRLSYITVLAGRKYKDIFKTQKNFDTVSKKSDLVIDNGNTRMKIGLFIDSRLDGVLSFSNHSVKDVEKLIETSGALRGVMSSVTEVHKPLYDLLKGELDMLEISPATKIPISLDYDTPHTLGMDRVANAAGAYLLYPDTNVLVIDFGTCIKYDLIDSGGTFRGGAIAPGVSMRFKSMHEMTGKLPYIKHWTHKEVTWPGKSTQECMVTGVIEGIQSEMSQYISTASGIYGNLTVISTGGDFSFFEKAFKNLIFAHPYLTLQGLHEILKFNMD
ncbi:MAG: type III pantothenate kinase [Flavobacteriales bacterium]|nr:type III pantothenate kinase [Flavobacteriales bacterium]